MIFAVELYAVIRRAVMVTGLADGKQLYSTLGYISPMAFEKERLAEARKLVA